MDRAEVGAALLSIARGAIARELDLAHSPGIPHAELTRVAASFVTLRRDGELRGCIGTVDAWRSLADDVHANAMAAAFRDPRFSRLCAREFTQIAIEVSVLNPSERMTERQEEALAAALRPGVDGVLLECARHRATFLPQVWEQLPHPHDFLRALKRKAGLVDTFWSDDVRVCRYTVEKFAEEAA